MDEKILKRLLGISKGDPVLSSPTRLAIMILLYLNMKMKFTLLQKALDLTPGNLASHLRKLEKENLVEIKKGFVDLRPTTIVKITEKGVEHVKSLIESLKGVLEILEIEEKTQEKGD